MSVIVRFGQRLKILADQEIQVYDKLPVGNYVVCCDNEGYFLVPADEFKLPEKIYGSINYRAQRILDTFQERPSATGVHFTGEKGSGKSMLAKRVCQMAAERGIPTIIINTAFHGDNFNQFIQSIESSAIILFDEFEKTYNREDQEAILTLLDGVFPSKKLFVLTTNNKYSVSTFLNNRPGRIYYQFEFDNLEEEFVQEFCEDNLKNKEHMETVLRFVRVFSGFNFDMLKAAIEEMNRYNEPFETVLKYLNIEPEMSTNEIYDSVVIVGDQEMPWKKNISRYDYLKFSEYLRLSKVSEKLALSEEFEEAFASVVDKDGDVNIDASNLVDIDGANGAFVYKISGEEKEIQVKITRQQAKQVIDHTQMALGL